MADAITIRGLTKTYGGRTAVDGIDRAEYFEAVGEQREAPRVDFGQRDAVIPPPSGYAAPPAPVDSPTPVDSPIPPAAPGGPTASSEGPGTTTSPPA